MENTASGTEHEIADDAGHPPLARRHSNLHMAASGERTDQARNDFNSPPRGVRAGIARGRAGDLQVFFVKTHRQAYEPAAASDHSASQRPLGGRARHGSAAPALPGVGGVRQGGGGCPTTGTLHEGEAKSWDPWSLRRAANDRFNAPRVILLLVGWEGASRAIRTERWCPCCARWQQPSSQRPGWTPGRLSGMAAYWGFVGRLPRRAAYAGEGGTRLAMPYIRAPPSNRLPDAGPGPTPSSLPGARWGGTLSLLPQETPCHGFAEASSLRRGPQSADR